MTIFGCRQRDALQMVPSVQSSHSALQDHMSLWLVGSVWLCTLSQMKASCTPVPGLLNTHSTALLSPPSVTATSSDHPKVYKLNYQLVISRKKAHPSRDSWDPRREWRSLMSTSLSVVPIQLNLVRNSESRSALSILHLLCLFSTQDCVAG